MGVSRIFTRTWPKPGCGTGLSVTVSTSVGSPYRSKQMARMLLAFRRVDGVRCWLGPTGGQPAQKAGQDLGHHCGLFNVRPVASVAHLVCAHVSKSGGYRVADQPGRGKRVV